jgi:predicted HD phosphohydrolase
MKGIQVNLPLHLAGYRDINAFIEGIDVLFMTRGHQIYGGMHNAGLTVLEHCLQCAQLAEWAHAPAGLVTAALLHDVGHLLTPPEMVGHGEVDDSHEERAQVLLSTALPAEVTEPVRLHVAAKRYLCATEPGYFASLSSDSVESLALQGGPMTQTETADFERQRYWREAVALRRIDEQAKDPNGPLPPFADFHADITHAQTLSPPTSSR